MSNLSKRTWARISVVGVALAAILVAVATLPDDGNGELVPVQRDVEYAYPGGPALDVYLPEGGGQSRPAVLLVHGGAWARGEKGDVLPTALKFADAGFVAFAVGYTLSGPDVAGFPRQVREVRAATRFVRDEAGRFGVDPDRVGALGVSAGAHLVTLAGATGNGPLDSGVRLGAVVSWSAPLDLRPPYLPVLEREIDWFLGCAPVACPQSAAQASPIVHIGPGDSPTLIVNSTEELIPEGQARRTARRLRLSGVPYGLLIVPGNLHAPLFEDDVIGPSIRFMRRHLDALGG